MTERDLPHVDGVEHRYFDLGGWTAHVAEAGSGDPLLLIHGWPQHWYEWHAVIPALAERYRVIAPDLRGFGWSDAPGSGYDPPTFAADQIALLDALEIKRARVIGHDWGGFTAFLLGLTYPDRIDGLIACNTPHPWARPDLRTALELWRIWYVVAIATPSIGRRLLNNGVIARTVLERGNVSPDPYTDGEVASYVDSFRPPERAAMTQALYRWYLKALNPSTLGRWAGLRLLMPALLLFGARDLWVTKRVVPGFEPHADDMSAELVPDSGHFLVNEKPELVVDRALALFGSHG